MDLVKRLGGTWHGLVAQCRCPAHDDREPSLSLRQGDRGVLVTCHAGCAPEVVLKELSRIGPLPDTEIRTRSAPVRPSTAHITIWAQARSITGTLAERYVRTTRNIWGPLDDVRFHPRCPLGKKADAQFLPALVIALRRDGQLAAIQRIFLDPETARYTRKATLGQSIGAAWTSNAIASTIAIGAGFETAAAYRTLTGTLAWATMGDRRLDQVLLPQAVRTVILLEENDNASEQACATAAAAYEAQGRRVILEPAPYGLSDWADCLVQHPSES